MSSVTITFTGNSSSLNAHFYPEIELDERFNYSCCLLDLYTYNSIPNVHENNNKFYYSLDKGETYEVVTLPIGSFEVNEILQLLMAEFDRRKVKISIKADDRTTKCNLKSENAIIDFTKADSICTLLGFSKRILGIGTFTSDKLINIQCINNLKIDCDLITGSFHNGKSTHTIYEFDPSVDPGYKINEQPKHLIYLPVIRHRISTINIAIVDQNGELVDFRGETITCRIHVKRDI